MIFLSSKNEIIELRSNCQFLLSLEYIAKHHISIIERSETSMTEYRTHMKIIGDILSTTRDEPNDEHGATVTYLIRKANVSHSRISRILKNLVSQGLLEQTESDGSYKYRISQTGREFLQAYKRFSEFADNFGLAI